MSAWQVHCTCHPGLCRTANLKPASRFAHVHSCRSREHVRALPSSIHAGFLAGRPGEQGKTLFWPAMKAVLYFYLLHNKCPETQDTCPEATYTWDMRLQNLLRCCGGVVARNVEEMTSLTPKIWQSPLWETPLRAFRFKRDIVDTFFHASRAACLT